MALTLRWRNSVTLRDSTIRLGRTICCQHLHSAGDFGYLMAVQRWVDSKNANYGILVATEVLRTVLR